MKNTYINDIPSSELHYVSGEYWKDREKAGPTMTYKARLVISLFEGGAIPLPPVMRAADIGCGNGSFLLSLADYFLSKNVRFQLCGYDISPKAISLAKEGNRHGARISWQVGRAADMAGDFDYIFCCDVLEHVENPLLLLRELAGKSQYVILHLPLGQSLAHMLMRHPSKSYNQFRHIHFFSWETAKVLIAASPFEIVHYQFDASSKVSLSLSEGLVVKAAKWLRYLLYKVHEEIATIVTGGSVVLVLKNKDPNHLKRAD